MVAVAGLGPRLGLAADDVAVLVAMVEHHLLLPDAATRRDLDDPATAQSVADAVGSTQVLELLHALTEADSAATGPAAWSTWKAGLVSTLVRRAGDLLAGRPVPAPAPLADWQQELVRRGAVALEAVGDEVTMTAPDRRGLLGAFTGVLALHRLDVRSAAVRSVGGTAVVACRVAARFGSFPDWAVVRDDLRKALSGELRLIDLVAAREAAYPARPGPPPAAATARFVEGASESASVLEVRAPDALGVLHRITTALSDCGLDVRSAHISTLGADVVDAFYLVGPDGHRLAAGVASDVVVEAVLAALR